MLLELFCGNYEGSYSFEIANCKNFGNVTSRSSRAGGILANRSDWSITILISNCYNYATISSNGDCIGGIVGLSNVGSGGISLNKCFNKGLIIGNNYVGGLVGLSSDENYYSGYLTVNNCFNESIVSGVNYVGGLVGKIGGRDQNTCSFTSSYNTGTVTSTGNNVGGLCGFMNRTNIKNCYNSANITSTSRNGIGGLVGYSTNSSQLQNCYNIGKVSGEHGRWNYQRSVGWLQSDWLLDSILSFIAQRFGELEFGAIRGE